MAVESTECPRPVHGLPRVVRHITGHNSEGKSVFLSTDGGEHHRGLVNKSAVVSTLYSTQQHPVDLNAGADIKYARKNELGISAKNGTVCRMIDFAPSGVLPMHRVQSLDYAIVIEGIFKVILDSGEERIIQRGDITIQRSTSHEWINITGDGRLPGRVVFVLLDTKETHVTGSQVNEFFGLLGKDYAGLNGHVATAPTPTFKTNDYFESEF
nr:cupin domain-containing protein StrE [Stachybotrys sp.]